MSSILTITKDNFDQVIEAHESLVIDFWAEWCAPCKAFHEIFARAAKDYPNFTFATVNIEAEKVLADEFEVRTIPALMILRSQCVVAMETGAMSDHSFRELLDKAAALDIRELKGQ